MEESERDQEQLFVLPHLLEQFFLVNEQFLVLTHASQTMKNNRNSIIPQYLVLSILQLFNICSLSLKDEGPFAALGSANLISP